MPGFRSSIVILFVALLQACGGGGVDSGPSTTQTYSVGGSVTGLTGTVVLQDSAGANLNLTANGSFTFATKLASGSSYAVTVLTQPAGEVCTVANGSGAMGGANVSSVVISCSAIVYSLSGSVSGLTGTVVLQDNGGDSLTLTTNGNFTFTTKLASGSSYAVAVLTQPTGEVCTVDNASGNVGGANVGNVAIICSTNAYSLGGAVSGLTGTVVLQDNASDNLSLNANGSFNFTTPVAQGATYNVTVLTQPNGTSCSVTNGSGTMGGANVSNVGITCTQNTYTIGGSVSGLTGTVVLQDNGGDNLSRSTNGSFTFGTALTSGTGYAVTVLTQPTGQICTVTSGTGTVATNVTNVAVVCAGSTTWTWESGSSSINAGANYGTLGVASASNVPGSRTGSTSWTDAQGNFWMFGGIGHDSLAVSGELNDLWKWNGTQWTWVSGSNTANASGSYGTLGVASASNVPGARTGGNAWNDASGNFWLFGGSTGGQSYLNDLWKWNGTQWTWVSGPSTVNAIGSYGTLGVASASNVPPPREWSGTWTDASGNFWLFGGYGFLSNGNFGWFNDLWKWNGSQWTWVAGSNTINASGTYGTLGTASSSNIPGARLAISTWKDASGNFWLLGGEGYGANGAYGELNDLWKWNGTQWTWVSGSSGANASGSYGTKGTASASNVPAGRFGGSAWTDASGNFWLFGGAGFDATGTGSVGLNDLWKWNGTQWTWVSGSSAVNASGSYGTQGTASASNVPGARYISSAWSDASGNLWVFGGYGYDSTGAGPGALNDLWMCAP